MIIKVIFLHILQYLNVFKFITKTLLIKRINTTLKLFALLKLPVVKKKLMKFNDFTIPNRGNHY